MRIRSLTASAALLALSCFLHTTPAKADTYEFSLAASSPQNGPNMAVTVFATLYGTPDPSVAGAYDLTRGSGTFNGTDFTLYTSQGLIPAGSYEDANFSSPPFTYASTYYYDNVVYTSGNGGLALDEYGLLFSEADDHFNPFIQGSNYVYTNDETVNGFNAPLYSLTLTDLGPVSVTPEPTSIALLGTGILGSLGFLRRRRTA